MNKWIPISLLVFLGIYLLTTAQAPVIDPPAKQFADALSEESNNEITYTLR